MYNVEFPPNGHDVEGGYLTENCTILAEGVWKEDKSAIVFV